MPPYALFRETECVGERIEHTICNFNKFQLRELSFSLTFGTADCHMYTMAAREFLHTWTRYFSYLYTYTGIKLDRSQKNANQRARGKVWDCACHLRKVEMPSASSPLIRDPARKMWGKYELTHDCNMYACMQFSK